MLEKFADMNLQYQGETIWVPETKLGTYIGSGDGTVAGEALSGNVKWSLFENQAPDVCDFTLVGTIAEAGGSDGRHRCKIRRERGRICIRDIGLFRA
jgi:hypothetical protein